MDQQAKPIQKALTLTLTEKQKKTNIMSRLEAMEKVAQEEATRRAEERAKGIGNIFRFWLGKGEEQEIIFLTESLESAFPMREHNLKGPDGKYTVFEPCVTDLGVPCPICETMKDSPSYFVVYFWILVPDAYRDKRTNRMMDSKKLLAVKFTQWPTMKKILLAAQKKHGTLRGVSMVMSRDSNPSVNSPNIGTPTVDDNGDMFVFYDEKTLVADYGNDVVLGQDKKTVIRNKNANITVIEWEEIFKQPDVKQLRQRYGGAAPFGSREYNDEAEREEDEAPRRQSRATRTSRTVPDAQPEPRARGRGRGAVQEVADEPQEDQDTQEGDEIEEEAEAIPPPPSRPRRTVAQDAEPPTQATKLRNPFPKR